MYCQILTASFSQSHPIKTKRMQKLIVEMVYKTHCHYTFQTMISNNFYWSINSAILVVPQFTFPPRHSVDNMLRRNNVYDFFKYTFILDNKKGHMYSKNRLVLSISKLRIKHSIRVFLATYFHSHDPR